MTWFLTGAEPDNVTALVRGHHYSGRMPGNIQHIYAVRSSGGLFGDFGEVHACAIWSIPPTRWREPVIELTRLVRRPTYREPLTQLLSFCVKRLRAAGHNLAVSFADRTERHHGGIYQAAGWNYAGCRDRRMDGVLLDGTFIPGRSCNSKWGTRSPDKLRLLMPSRDVQPHFDEGKHCYWMPLHRSGLRKAERLELGFSDYPKEYAGRPKDEASPLAVSKVQPLGSAPSVGVITCR